MAKTKQMSLKDSIYIRTLHQKFGITIYKIMNSPKLYPTLACYPKTTLYRHAKKPLDAEDIDRRKFNTGRKRKTTVRELRTIKRQVKIMREEYGTFTSRQLQIACGLENSMSNSTFRRALKSLGYQWRNTRRKGKLLKKDLVKRVEFCNKMNRLKINTQEFWCNNIALYVDGVGFEYKSNPYEHAKELGSREWRMKSEGLDFNCTAKGAKEGKKMSKFMVGMSYGKGVILCVPLKRRMCGEYFAQIVRDEILPALHRSGKASKRILQDGDPSQNSKKSLKELYRQNIRLFSIPPRSPDLNPIENLFNQVRMKIKSDSLSKQLTFESKETFRERVQNLLVNFDQQKINNIIKSMPKRVKMIKKGKGKRIKY